MADNTNKSYKPDGSEYDPKDRYFFKDSDGNSVVATGDNGYVWQAITNGVPISVNDKGEWYVEPYLEVTPQDIIAHVPEWFKGTDEYSEWKNKYSGYIQPGINADTFNQLNNILKGYGSQGAARTALGARAASFGITDPNLQKKYTKDYVALYNEGEGNGSANIELYEGGGGQSAADIARDFKNLSKEDLSKTIGALHQTLEASKKNGWGGSIEEQKAVLAALQTVEILNHVDDNYSKFGKDDEFKGLLEASAWQKVYSGIEASNQQLTNSIAGVIPRAFHGVLSAIFSPDHTFDTSLAQYSDYTTDASAGAWLEGREGFISIGNVIGSVESFVVTLAVSSSLAGGLTKLAAVTSGSANTIFSAAGHFARSAPGKMVVDFALHDVPIDFLNFFTTISENGGDAGKAWYNPDQQQNLIAIPIIGEFGPKVQAGLMNDLIGDAVVDLSIPVVSALFKATADTINDVTDGAATRFKEYVAVKNLALQEKLTNIPVVGTGWKKIMNHFMGAENAAFIRDARKASIAEGNMDWYKIANDVLTLKNHGGAEEVAVLYNKLLDKIGVMSDIKQFQKDAPKFGGLSKTQVSWKEAVGGQTKNLSRTVDDVLPQQVKQGLLDIERLSELRGQEMKEGGLIQNTERTAEIQRLEAKVEKLPQEIKDFADKMSEANKALEKIGVQLGIKNEDWYKAMELDPEFEKYMTRQALVPGQGRAGGDAEPAQIFKGRKGYYADNYIDPTIALNMKAAALGRAYAWNQQAKTVVAMQIAQGKVIAGKGGVTAAKKMQEVKNKIANVEAVRKALDYDGVTGTMSKDVRNISNAINEVNALLNAPEKISLKSIYSAGVPPVISEFVSDFETGKVKFGDGVKAKAGLSDTDAALMVRNTYSYVTTKADGTSEMLIAKADSAKAATDTSGNIYNAGVAPDGTAYRYSVKDGVITDIKEITDPHAVAETINRLGGIYKTDAETVRKIGIPNSRAVNRAILFYRDNMPNLPFGPTFRTSPSSAYGSIPWASGGGAAEYRPKIVDGHIECEEFPLYLHSPLFKAGNEDILKQSMENDLRQSFHPKNSLGAENTPIHEMGHNTMMRLAVLTLNEDIDAGKVKLRDGMSQMELGDLIQDRYFNIHKELARRAFAKVGIDVEKLIKEKGENAFNALWQDTAYNNISHYAGTKGNRKGFQRESFAEAVVDVWANNDQAAKISVAMVEEMRKESQRFAKAASPKRAMQQNGIPIKNELFDGENWNFPKNAKTNKQKAQWLAKERSLNPLLDPDFGPKGMFTTDQYIKANMWDTFFKKEIESYDPNCKTTMPDALVKKNGDFLEDLANNTAKKLVEKIKAASVEGFDENLATIALGSNAAESAEALDNFIISRINGGARKIAEKMEGGATEANLNQARITLWQDDSIKREMTSLLNSLAPDLSMDDVNKKIEALFKEQAEGLASYEALGVDFKNLNEEYKNALGQLEKSNAYAMKTGREIDKKLAAEGYKGDATQTIHYREGGEDVYVVVSDPVTASILKRPDDFKNNGTTANAFMYAANSIARMYRLGTTGLNPIAVVRNVLRDPLQATLTAGFNPLSMSLDPTYYYKTWRQFGLDDATIKQVETKIRNWASTGTMTSEIKKFGGELPGTAGYRSKSEQFQKWFNKKIDNSKIVNIGEKPLEIWESTFRSQVGLQSFTKGLKRTGGDIDKALASAMFDTSNATTNFSHTIYFMRRFSSSVPYLASAINGTASFWRLFNIDPIGMMGRITAGILVPVAAITAWNLSEEERRKSYMNLPEWYRDGHFVIVDNDGNIFSMPIPDEIGNYFGTVRRLVEYTNEANQYSIPSILAQGAFGFLPVEVDGFFNEDGSLNIQRGIGQLMSGLMPQTATVLYELAFNEKLYTGQDITDYSTFNKIVNALGNTFGSFAVNIVNDLGFLAGSKEDMIVGRTTAETLARDLFGMGFDNAKQQFMQLVGSPEHLAEDGKTVVKATGLFKEAEDIQRKMEDIDKKIAFADEDKKKELEDEREKLIEDFGQRVKNLMNKYMSLFSTTGGLELWQRKKLIQILALGQVTTSAGTGTWQEADATQAELNEWGVGRQRYVDLGLPSGTTTEALGKNENGNLTNSLDLQAKIDSFYGAPKQATQDYKKAIEDAGIKDIRDRFYATIQKVYDIADANNIDPDYDLIEKIQARYLQSVDSVLVPLINKYGLSILNNNDFIDAVRRQVNGMIPSDDWRQSVRNAKKFLSTKDFPTATVDVKKWLKERYTSNMRDRGLDSDPEVTEKLNTIKSMIDRGEKNAAKGEIESLNKGINQSQYYISSQDYQTLVKYYGMVK